MKMQFAKQVLLACSLTMVPMPAGAAQAGGEIAALEVLARTPPEQYRIRREEFLRAHANQIDVVEAIKAGWEPGLMALIVNSHLEHAGEYHLYDDGHPMQSRAGFYYYGALVLSNSIAPLEASVFECLWKGGRIGLADQDAAGSKNEFGLLPVNGRRQIIGEVCTQRRKIGAAISDSLLLALAQGDAPEEVREMAVYILSGRETAAARDIVFRALTETNEAISIRTGALHGLAAYTPSYGWAVLRDSLGSWKTDTNLTWLGFAALSEMPDTDGHALLRSIAVDTNAPASIRLNAVGALDKKGEEAVDTMVNILRDATASAELKRRAVGAIGNCSGERVRNLIEGLDLKTFDPATQVSLVRLPAHVPMAGRQELLFIRALSERSDIAPEVRDAARKAASDLAGRIKDKP